MKDLSNYSKTYEQIVELIPDFGLKHSQKEWIEAHIAFNSRNFLDAESGSKSLIPFIELFNHSNPPDVRWNFFTDASGDRSLRLTAERDIAKGGEVFDSYGSRNNFDLMVSYGFLIPNNPDVLEVAARLVYSANRNDLLDASLKGTLNIGTGLLTRNFNKGSGVN